MARRFSMILAVTSLLLAQNDQKPIRVQVNEVIVPVTVIDEKNRFVSNLDATDFHIFDEGKEQKIQFFSRERSQPVVVCFLLDVRHGRRLHLNT